MSSHRVTDAEAVAMSRHLVNVDGLFLGSSSACNLVACARLAKTLPPGSTVVTILCVLSLYMEVRIELIAFAYSCDSGSRHQSKVRLELFFTGIRLPDTVWPPLQFWSDDYLRAHRIPISDDISGLLG